jgi:alkanesulfonate monooxygenase SsuD/methylene tetrahydromethanopterin reductase-like flavin-dependent oxidoreductase (luciferase family)
VGGLRFGLFDHVERNGASLAQEFDERLEFVAAADDAGFFCYHVAEHHCTPLNMVPSPAVYLAAVARATKRIHLGPLVYLLPLYSPLRVIEEISMLDHLSHGRLEVGVGRGVSPFELRYQHVDAAESRDIFIEAYTCVKAGLTHDTLDHAGTYFSYAATPMPLKPLQRPFPPFWYGSSNAEGSSWAGAEGMHYTTNGPTARAKANIAAFKTALARRGGPAIPLAAFDGGTAIGVLRHVVVAPSDAEAERIARPAFEYHLANLNYLRNLNGSTEFTARLHVHQDLTFDDAVANGMVVAGTPQTVTAKIAAQAGELGITYLLAYLFFGTMRLADAARSLRLFKDEVMPALEALPEETDEPRREVQT